MLNNYKNNPNIIPRKFVKKSLTNILGLSLTNFIVAFINFLLFVFFYVSNNIYIF